MHRIINQNFYSKEQIIFKNYPLFNLDQLMQKKLNEQANKGQTTEGHGTIKEDKEKGLPHKDMRML